MFATSALLWVPLAVATAAADSRTHDGSKERTNERAAAAMSALFDATGPAYTHYRARVVDGAGKAHRLEVWRDGDRRVRRLTDDRVEMFAERRANGVALVVHDRGSQRTYTADAQEMLGMGRTIHWTDVAYGLRLPVVDAAGGPPLTGGQEVRTKVPGVESCQEYTVGTGRQRFSFCWSAALKLPVTVKTGRGVTLFQLEEASTEALPATIFEAPDAPSLAD